MEKGLKKRLSFGLIASLLLSTQVIVAQDGAALFKACAACHSIGGGKQAGPDLKGISKRRTKEWIVKFIQSPLGMQKSGDADAVAIFKEFNNFPMPDNALTAAQIGQIIDHVDGGSADGKAIDPVVAAAQQRVDAILKGNSPQNIQAGNDLFNGNTRFANGGVSCASCHSASLLNVSRGGILAKDLTKAYSRLGGFSGMKGIIQSAPFPSMNQSYKNSPVTEDEMAYVGLYLKYTDEQNAVEPVTSSVWFLHGGCTLAILLLIAIAVLWFKRKRKSVNAEIIKRQEKTSK